MSLDGQEGIVEMNINALSSTFPMARRGEARDAVEMTRGPIEWDWKDTVAYDSGAGSYRQLPAVTGSYRQLPAVTGSYLQLPAVTGSYRLLPAVTD